VTGCPWKIRPFPNPTELQCEREEHLDPPVPPREEHRMVLKDYAEAGSESHISWLAGDRREFTGDWPGYCGLGSPPCVLPAGHHRGHAP
jgi:hypothetical protein